MTASHEDKINSTHISTPADKTINSDLIPFEGEESHTSSKSPEKGQTAPSSKTDGSVWLRYAPRERATDISETT